MKPEQIRDQNIDKALDPPLVYDRRSLATFSPMAGVALIVVAVLLALRIDVLSLQGLLIVAITSGLAGLASRWAYDRMRPAPKVYAVAFSAPGWDSQLAEPVEIDVQDSTYFVDNSPAIETASEGEWVRLKLRSGVTTFILTEDLAKLSKHPSH